LLNSRVRTAGVPVAKKPGMEGRMSGTAANDGPRDGDFEGRRLVWATENPIRSRLHQASEKETMGKIIMDRPRHHEQLRRNHGSGQPRSSNSGARTRAGRAAYLEDGEGSGASRRQAVTNAKNTVFAISV
jgi:hypothetical protein